MIYYFWLNLNENFPHNSGKNTAERVKVSDRAAAMISNAVLEHFGITRQVNTSKVVDKNKMRRERKNVRLELQTEKAEKGDFASFVLRQDAKTKH